MNSPEEIKNLAWQRLEEAEILFNHQKYDGAFYLAGYSVELMLKAKICTRLGIPNLFDEQNPPANQRGIGEIKKSVKTHDLFVLLIFSGLKANFDKAKANSIELATCNSLLFSNWNENARYKPCGYMLERDIAQLIVLLKSENGILRWIENN